MQTKETTCYVLCDSGDKIWGVFTDTTLLYSMYHNLRTLDQRISLTIKEYSWNTNIVLSHWNLHGEIERAFNKNKREKTASSSELVVPNELKGEFQKLKLRLVEFKDNYTVFKRLLDEGIITVESPIKDVPILLRDRFSIFCDILKMKIPEEEMFSYFVDRYYPEPPKNLLCDSSDDDLNNTRFV